MSKEGKHVALGEIVAVCRTLDGLLCPSFGPNALHSLLSTSTGQLMVTSSGRAVLQSLHLAHPVGRLVTNAVLSYHKVAGDNSKTFLAILTEVLGKIEQHLDTGLTQRGGRDNPIKTCEKIAIVRALNDVKLRVLPGIQLQFVQGVMTDDGMLTDFKMALDMCLNVIWTSVQGRFNGETRLALLDLAREYLSRSCSCLEDLKQALQIVIDDFSFICVDSPGQSVLNSRVLEGVVIQRDFSPKTSQPKPLSNVNFILLRFPIEKTCTTESDSRILLSSFQQGKDSLSWKSVRLLKIIDALKSREINLIFSEEFVSESTSLLLTQNSINVVHSIEKEDFDHLEKVSGVNSVCEEWDVLMSGDSAIGRASKVETIVAGGKRSTLVKMENGNIKSQTILVCGPTPGMCDQYASAILCGFKSAFLAVSPHKFLNLEVEECQEHKIGPEGERSSHTKVPGRTDLQEGILVCPGGGAFELTAASLLKQYAKRYESENVTLSLTCKLLSGALLTVPLLLLKNSYLPQAERTSLVQLHELLTEQNGEQLDCPGQTLRFGLCPGIDVRSGKGPLTDCRIVESLAGKMMLLDSLVELLQQILRIDFIVPTQHLPKGGEVN